MSADPAAAGSDCIALAVAFARAPGQFPDLLYGRRRLPPGVTALLQAAAGSPLVDAESALSGAVSGEPQQAAQFFIEQVLLAHSADHYRVLGVDPLATPEEIKEHHRLLMRLFHPDRQATPDARTDAFATRINQAYTALRYPDTRVAYDLTLAEKRKVTATLPSYRSQPQRVDSPGPLLRMPPFVLRHLPQFALGSIALLAALGVTLVYVNRVPTGAIGTGDSKFAHAPESAAPRTLPPDLPPAIARALAEPIPADPSPPTAARLAETVVPVAESSRERESAVMPAAVKVAVAKPAPPPMVAPPRSAESTSPVPVAEAKAPTPAPVASVAPVAVNPPAAPEIRPAPLRTDQLNGLVTSLSEQYQQGDLENLLALFDASARMECGDKKQIRAEYGELFRNSESRALHIWDMAWSGDGKVTRGEGSFQARVLHKGDRSFRVYNGAVTIEVVQHNDRPLIVGLYQKTGN